MSIEDQEEMGAKIPNLRRHMSNGSHLSIRDKPENFFNYMTEFVNDVELGLVLKRKR